MKKLLINHRNLKDYLNKNSKEFIVDERMILSPGALDKLGEMGLNVIYKRRNPVSKTTLSKLRPQIRELINKEGKVTAYGKVDEFVDMVIEKIEREGYYGD